MKGTIEYLAASQATEFLLPKHYSGRKPVISIAFGWKVDGEIKAVCTFGKPASPSLCKGIMGGKYVDSVYELNRLCRVDDFQEPLSCFVSACLRRLRPNNWIIVSFSDTLMNHHGYIYQACNFMYTGCTKERTDIYTGVRKHSRHYSDEDKSNGMRIVRSAKHRYVYFCTFNKKLKKQWKDALAYPIMPYPKGDNSNYTLGEYAEQPIVIENTDQITLPSWGAV